MMQQPIIHLATKTLLWLAALTGAPTPDATRQVDHCNALLEQASWDAYERECVAPGFRLHSPDGDADHSETIEFWKGAKAALPDIHFTTQLTFVDHDEVLALVLVTGTHDGVMHCHGDWAPTHKPVRVLTVQRFVLDASGRVVDEWLAYNAMDLLNQIGARPQS